MFALRPVAGITFGALSFWYSWDAAEPELFWPGDTGAHTEAEEPCPSCAPCFEERVVERRRPLLYLLGSDGFCLEAGFVWLVVLHLVSLICCCKYVCSRRRASAPTRQARTRAIYGAVHAGYPPVGDVRR